VQGSNAGANRVEWCSMTTDGHRLLWCATMQNNNEQYRRSFWSRMNCIWGLEASELDWGTLRESCNASCRT
jgi:hypothetical protein